MQVEWIELTADTMPPCNCLVWVERYVIGTKGVHHEVYIGGRLNKPLSTHPDVSRECYWFGRPLDEELYCEEFEGMKLGHSWSDATVKRWAHIKPPQI